MGRWTVPLLAAGCVVAAIALVVAVVAPPRPTGPPTAAVLSAEDRRALAADPVRRGSDPAPVDPAVDLRDPRAVARAYLAAAHSVGADDAGATQRRAAGYAAPGSGAATVGSLVLDPPPAGTLRTATVTGLALLAADRADRRRGYRAEIGIATGPPGAPARVELLTRDVVLVRDADGRWLVVADTVPSEDLLTGDG